MVFLYSTIFRIVCFSFLGSVHLIFVACKIVQQGSSFSFFRFVEFCVFIPRKREVEEAFVMSAVV
jgi:hypothetical protein